MPLIWTRNDTKQKTTIAFKSLNLSNAIPYHLPIKHGCKWFSHWNLHNSFRYFPASHVWLPKGILFHIFLKLKNMSQVPSLIRPSPSYCVKYAVPKTFFIACRKSCALCKGMSGSNWVAIPSLRFTANQTAIASPFQSTTRICLKHVQTHIW